jgi:hypothetical protein
MATTIRFADFIAGQAQGTGNLSANVNTSGSSNVTYQTPSVNIIKVGLTSAQIKSLNTTPILAIPDAPTGYVIQVLQGFVDYTYGTHIYSSSLFNLKSLTATTHQFEIDNVQNTALSVRVYGTVISSPGTTQILTGAGSGLYLYADLNSALGDGTANFYFTYQLINL